MQYKILIVSDDASSAMSYYRTSLPLNLLAGINHNIEYDVVGYGIDITWDILIRYNILLMQRPSGEGHMALLIRAKNCGLKVWVDYDDMLWGVTSDSPVWEHYQDNKTLAYIKTCIVEADICSVSTPFLANEVKKFCDVDAVVVRNAVKEALPVEFKPFKKVLWRGSHTHQKDLLLEREELVNLAMTNEDWRFIFFGMNPWFVTDYMPNYIHAGYTDLITYFEMMERIEASLAYVPLWDSAFNRSKSDIAALEALNAGMIPVATPDMEEWSAYLHPKMEGGVTERLESFMNMDMKELKWFYDSLKEDIRTIDAQNKIRYDIICGL